MKAIKRRAIGVVLRRGGWLEKMAGPFMQDFYFKINILILM